ncbi:MAG: radical SAM protein [Halobacteriota archaeon]|nr:radical SAM protein [Halobacteriota archaeon]
MDIAELSEITKYSFEMGAIRPPSEGGAYSLLIRATRNCPWNRCTFCYGTPYRRAKFELRSVEEVKRDIDSAKAILDIIMVLQRKLGGIDWVVNAIDSYTLYGKESHSLRGDELNNFQSIVNVFNWFCSGAKTVFLQDANSLIMRTPQLVEVIRYLKETFPSIERITSYARSQTLAKKSIEELTDLKVAGLTRVHVGLETGDDELLEFIKKGVSSEEQILGGRKTKEAGIELSEYVMPGLGGKTMSEQHARNTARVLNEIDPDYIRLRTYIPNPLTPLFKEMSSGNFEMLSPHESLNELKILVEDLNVTSKMTFDHAMNYWCDESYYPLFRKDYEGYKFPEEKDTVLALIDKGLALDESYHSSVRSQIRSL